MNIIAHVARKVVVTEKSFGYLVDTDKKQVEEHLEIGKIYTVRQINICSNHTSVWLKEVPGQEFNGVLFEDADKNKKW